MQKEQHTMRSKGLQGITLMELIVTVVIIGVLAGTTTFGFRQVLRKADAKKAKTDLLLIKAAQNIYFAKHNYYYPYAPATGCTAQVATSAINAGLNLNLKDSSAGACQPLSYVCGCSLTSADFDCISICQEPYAGGLNVYYYRIRDNEDVPTCWVGSCPE